MRIVSLLPAVQNDEVWVLDAGPSYFNRPDPEWSGARKIPAHVLHGVTTGAGRGLVRTRNGGGPAPGRGAGPRAARDRATVARAAGLSASSPLRRPHR
ncbi:hypothetical protein [Actinomadura sp. 3N407]|uniref:hypothetical protein n=1 Tax=Actinomadura sp. 3N407 TaxID=3457423 RepID=UPI003FCED60A